MFEESLKEQREVAARSEIERLQRYIADGCREVWEACDLDAFDVDLSLVTSGGNAEQVDAAATVEWHTDRAVHGDVEVGDEFPVIDVVTVYAAVDGPWLPMRDVTRMLSTEAREEIREQVQHELERVLRDRIERGVA